MEQGTIQKNHNCLKLHFKEDTVSYLKISNAAKRLLREVRTKKMENYFYVASPGTYHLETDGEILKVESILFEQALQRRVDIIHVHADGQIQYAINGIPSNKKIEESLEEGKLTLDDLKTGMVSYYEQETIRRRKTILPDEQLFRAFLGTYDGVSALTVRKTFAKFNSELQKTKKALEKAKNLTAIRKAKPQFPTKLLGEIKESPSKKTVKKK